MATALKASESLPADLRSDVRVGWVPQSGWLANLPIETNAADLTFDLASSK